PVLPSPEGCPGRSLSVTAERYDALRAQWLQGQRREEEPDQPPSRVLTPILSWPASPASRWTSMALYSGIITISKKVLREGYRTSATWSHSSSTWPIISPSTAPA